MMKDKFNKNLKKWCLLTWCALLWCKRVRKRLFFLSASWFSSGPWAPLKNAPDKKSKLQNFGLAKSEPRNLDWEFWKIWIEKNWKFQRKIDKRISHEKSRKLRMAKIYEKKEKLTKFTFNIFNDNFKHENCSFR